MAARGTVRHAVRSAWLGVHALRAVEGLLVGATACLLTLCAARLAGGAAPPGQTWAAALLCGLLAAAGWWLERTQDRREVARAMDREAALDGALFTALEAEGRADQPLGGLLAARVPARAAAGRFVRRSTAGAVALLAAPLAAAALLHWTEERSALPARFPAPETSVAATGAGLRARAEELLARTDPAAETGARLRELALEAGRIEARARMRAGDPAALRAALRETGARLAAIEAGMTRDHGDGTMSGRIPGLGADAGLRNGSEKADVAPSASSPGSGSESGVGGPSWWPRRYDAVVERWVEARREAGLPR